MRNVWEALSDPTRREILKILKKGELTAGEIFNYFTIGEWHGKRKTDIWAN